MEFGIGSTVTLGTINVTTLKSIDFPAMEFDKVETTNLSTTGGRTYKPVPLGDPGEIQMEVEYDPANYLALEAIQGVDAKALSAVIAGTSTTRTVTAVGWLKSIKPKVNGVNEIDTATIVFQPNSAITVT